MAKRKVEFTNEQHKVFANDLKIIEMVLSEWMNPLMESFRVTDKSVDMTNKIRRLLLELRSHMDTHEYTSLRTASHYFGGGPSELFLNEKRHPSFHEYKYEGIEKLIKDIEELRSKK